MSLDFFDNPYKLSLTDIEFGLCDDTDLPTDPPTPAYVDLVHPEEWIAVVKNPLGKAVDFYPIDAVLPLLRTNGEQESRCDVMLDVKESEEGCVTLFVELKDRHSKGWLTKATDQLLITLEHFSHNHPVLLPQVVCCYVSNKQRPNFSNSYKTELLRFATESRARLGASIVLKVQQTIEL